MNKMENLIASTLLQNIIAVPMSNNITLGFYRKAGVSTAANSKLNKRIGQHDFLFSTFFISELAMITARELMSSCTLALSSQWR